QFCQENPKECQEWCEKNPESCGALMRNGSSKVVDPPNTAITFAKTLNLNADQFTEEDIIKAKKLGANMITIWPARIINNDEFIFFPERISGMINFAHQEGLQVELRSSFAGEIINDYEKFKSNAIDHVAEFAQFAEQHKVYRIIPFGEIDNNMFNHCEKITELSQELLEEMKKHYSGQIGVGIVGSWRDCNYIFKEYDYLAFSAYPQRQIGIDKWLTPNPDAPRIIENNNLALMTKWAREVADRSGISVIHIGETGVINPDDEKREDAQSFSETGKEEEAEFYGNLFEQVSDNVNGISVFYNSRTDYFSINGDPAEEVVREWYTNRL
ncbi:MAG: hypothetical protein AABX84_00765, partial [Nanoarchaeota archaeon]